MAKAADYSWARPAPAALTGAGFTAALRYLSHEPAKNLSPGERDALHAAGLAVGLVWESTASRALSGYAAGRADARDANRQADALGFPASKVLFYAVDISTGPGPVTDYFRGVEDEGGRPVGVYGTYDVIEGLVGSGFVSCGWQCAAWSGTGSGSGGSYDGRRLSRHACLFQRAATVLGGSVDENVVLMDPSPWAWHPNQPITEEDDMAPPVILRTKPGSQWARDVAGRAPGDEVACFIAYPSSGVIVWIRDEAQLNGDLFVGTVDRGPTEDQWFYNFTLQPHDGRAKAATVNLPAIESGVVEQIIEGTAARTVAKLGAELND